MAFNLNNWLPISAQANSNAPRLFTYETADTLSQISVTDYFLQVIGQVEDGDLVYSVCSDGNFFGTVTIVGGSITWNENGGTRSEEVFSQSEATLSNGSSIDTGWIDMDAFSKYQISYIGSAALSLSIESRATDSGSSELTTPAPYTGTFYLADLVPRQRYMRFILTNDTGGNVTSVNMAIKAIYGGLDGASVFPLEVAPSQFSPASLTQSVLIGKDSGGNYRNLNINQAGALVAADFNAEVARGTEAGYTLWNKFGYNTDIDTAAGETIWSVGGMFQPLSSGETVDVVSSDANDTNGGTGVNSVVLYGVDENWLSQTEVVTMNGTTPVTTTSQWLGINRVAVFLSGSGQTNAGAITVTASTAATVQAEMPAGGAVTQQCIFFVPADTNFVAEWLWVNAVKTSGGGNPELTITMNVYSAVNNTKQEVFRGTIDTAVGNFMDINPRLPFPIGEKSCVTLEGVTTTNNTQAKARFSGILIQDA
jgi:hypothetical protein